MNYSRTFGSNFPNECIPFGKHKDVDNAVVGLVNQYNAYVQAGDMVSASGLYYSNRSKLEPYILNMSFINRLEEEIYNTGLYAISNNSDPVISDTEPAIEQGVNSYWFQDY